jgi:hypothetical protein
VNEPTTVLKRAFGVPYKRGGVEHSGWLPPGAAIPLPTPIRHLTLDITIETEGPGYLLVFAAREDPSFFNDYWFDALDRAEAAALEWFGIGPGHWQDD